MDHVIIVGAGIAGLSTAWYLQEHDIEVTVIDRAGIGEGASWGNAGQINPAFTVPLPSPGQVRYAMRAALDPSAALIMPLTFDRHWWRFAAQFTAHCTASRYRHAMSVLTELTSRAMEAFDELASSGITTPVQHARPLIAACRTTGERAHIQKELDAASAYGDEVAYEVTDGDDLRALEPHLSPRVQTGLQVHGQSYLHPPAYTQALAGSIRARGGTIHEGIPVKEVTDLGTGVELTTATGGPRRADHVVLATGAWLTEIASQFGIRRPVQGGRGYSFSVRPEHMPTHPIYLPGRKVVCTPLADRFRVTGMMELRHPEAAPDPRGIRRIIRSSQPMFTGIDWQARSDEWNGSRPLTPDGLPMVGATASPRVSVLGGHGMWGITHGPLTGKLLAEMIVGRAVPPWMTHLDPQR